MITRKQLYLGCAISASVLSGAAYGAGFALIEHSASGMGNAFAGGAASAEDASTVYFNPAGMMILKNNQMVVAGHFISTTAKFNNQGSRAASIIGGQPLLGDADQDGGTDALVPNFYYVRSLSDTMKFGLGVNVPFGLSVSYDDDWLGRYHGVESTLETLNINPSLAFKVSQQMYVGFGLSVQTTNVILSNAIDFGAICYAQLGAATCNTMGVLPQQTDGFAYLEGDNHNDLSFGWNAGLMFGVAPGTRLGVAYRSEIEHNVEGDADFTVPGNAAFVYGAGAFVDTGLEAEVTFPQSLSVSVNHKVNPDLEIMADVTWTDWSVFEELRIKFENPNQPEAATTEAWEDSMRYALGFKYRTYPNWVVRGGIAYDETPIPSAERRTPRIPGNDRIWLSFGLGHQLSKTLSLDLGYSKLRVLDARINNEYESSIPTLSANIEGEYDSSVDILSAQITWNMN